MRDIQSEVIDLLSGELGMPVLLDEGLREYEWAMFEDDDGVIEGFKVPTSTTFESCVSVRALAEMEARWLLRLLRAIPWIGAWAYTQVRSSETRRYADALGGKVARDGRGLVLRDGGKK